MFGKTIVIKIRGLCKCICLGGYWSFLCCFISFRDFKLEVVLFAGMDLHELLDIPQGDRRKYHDDVTVMIISLEGRIWKSSGKYL